MEEGGGGLGAMGWRMEEAGGEGVLAPTEYEWETEGGGGLRGNNVSVWDALV